MKNKNADFRISLIFMLIAFSLAGCSAMQASALSGSTTPNATQGAVTPSKMPTATATIDTTNHAATLAVANLGLSRTFRDVLIFTRHNPEK